MKNLLNDCESQKNSLCNILYKYIRFSPARNRQAREGLLNLRKSE